MPAEPGAWVEVLVVDDRGAPVEGAEIRVAPSREQLDAKPGATVETVTAPSRPDYVRVTVPWATERLTVYAEAPERQSVAARPLSAASGTRVRLQLEEGVEIRGRVTNGPEGSVAYVSAYSGRWPEVPGRRAIPTASDGTFRFVAPRGLLTMFARAEGRRPSPWWRQDITGPVADIVLSLGGPVTTVHGRVLIDRTSGSVPFPAGSTIYASQPGSGPLACLVGQAGAVDLVGLEAGRSAQIRIWPARGVRGEWLNASQLRELSASEVVEGLELHTKAAANCSFRVTDESGRPIAGLWLALEADPAPTAGTLEIERGVTSQDGAWKPFAKHDVAVQRARLVLPEGQRVVWSGVLDEASREVPVHFPRSDVVQIRLVDWSGHEVRSANVLVSALLRSAVPNSWDVQALSPMSNFGESSVVALVLPETADRSRALLVEQWVESRVVDLGPPDPAGVVTVAVGPNAGALRLELRDRSDEPQIMAVSIYGEAGTYSARSSDAGLAEFVGIRPGEYTVQWLRGDAFVSVEPAIVVRAGEWTHRTIVVQ